MSKFLSLCFFFPVLTFAEETVALVLEKFLLGFANCIPENPLSDPTNQSFDLGAGQDSDLEAQDA
jgi:hypothetical protein